MGRCSVKNNINEHYRCKLKHKVSKTNNWKKKNLYLLKKTKQTKTLKCPAHLKVKPTALPDLLISFIMQFPKNLTSTII